jgi:Lon protease-like protein
MSVMAMFPLGSVLLPGGVLPLHVFEPRYRRMVIDLLDQDGTPEFGEVLITRGAEAGGGDERAMVGTVAQMTNVEALDESRYALLAVGTRRISVNNWLPDDPYPRAEVDDWPDEDPDPPELRETVTGAHARVLEVLALAAEVGDIAADARDTKISDDPLVATYHLASLAPIGAADRYRLLAASGPAARLRALDGVLDDVEAMLRFRLS